LAFHYGLENFLQHLGWKYENYLGIGNPKNFERWEQFIKELLEGEIPGFGFEVQIFRG